MELTYLGTNTLFISKGTPGLLIDPHFSRPELFNLVKKIKPDKERIKTGLEILGINKLDGVLLTHTHYDHALDATEVINQVGGVLYGSVSAANLANGAGLPRDQYQNVMAYAQRRVGEFNIRWLPSQHISFPPPLNCIMPIRGVIKKPLSPPCYFWRYQCGAVYGLLIDDLLVFGSAGFIPDTYRDYQVRVVVLGIGGLVIKPHSYLENFYQETIVATGAQQVLISHWDDFFKPLTKDVQHLGMAKTIIHRIRCLGAHYGQSVRVLAPYETIDI